MKYAAATGFLILFLLALAFLGTVIPQMVQVFLRVLP